MTIDEAAKKLWMDLATGAYRTSSTYFDANIRKHAEAGLRLFQSQHPAGSKYVQPAYAARSKVFRPKTRAVIRKNSASAAEAFFATQDLISLEPQDGDDPRQVASAEINKELLQYRLRKSIKWYLTCNGAYQDAQTVGVCISYIYWHYNASLKIDKPCIDLIPIENFRFDPGATWSDPINTSPYLIQEIPMYVKDVMARMQSPENPQSGAPVWFPMSKEQLSQGRNRNYDVTRAVREPGRTDPKSESTSVTDFDLVWIRRYIVNYGDIDWVFYTLGDVGMLSEPVPLEDLYFHGRRPYTMGIIEIETHKNYPSGVTHLGSQIQGEINEMANSRLDAIKQIINKRYLVQRNKQVDIRSLTRATPGGVTLVDDIDKDVKWMDTPDIAQSAFNEGDRLNADFDEVAGSFSASSMQGKGNVLDTLGAADMLSTDANQINGFQLRTFVETWAIPTLEMLVLLEQHYETDEVILALAGNKANLFQRFGIDAITDELLMHELTCNVNVGMGATSPQLKLQRLIYAFKSIQELLADGTLQKYNINVQEVTKEVFGMAGYKDAMRFFKFDGTDPLVQDLQGQVQELTDALNAKHPPELIAAMVKKLGKEVDLLGAKMRKEEASKVKTGVEAMYSSIQTAEVIAAVPQVAPVADRIMEAAGYTPPVPEGVDPNLDGGITTQQPIAPAAAIAPEITMNPVSNKRTGTEFQPGAPNTDPLGPPPMPAPATPGTGQRDGIETQRVDGVGP